METCRCEEFREAVKKCTIFPIATFCPPFQRSSVPKEAHLHWKKNKTGPDDNRFHQPIVCATIPHTVCTELPVDVIQKVPNKWIPIETGLVSLRLVNESKGSLKGPI